MIAIIPIFILGVGWVIPALAAFLGLNAIFNTVGDKSEKAREMFADVIAKGIFLFIAACWIGGTIFLLVAHR